MRILDPAERSDLEEKLKKTRDLSEWKRIFVILEYDAWVSVEELALTLRISHYTIEDYLRDYEIRNKTKNNPRGGSQSKLTPKESKKLEEHLLQKTYLKVKGIMAYVKSEFGKTYSRSGMTAWLKTHGFTFKCPDKIPGKLNPEAQKAFVKEYENLKSTKKENEEIYFLDAVHPQYQSQAVCGWIKKGERKTLQTTGKQVRLHFVGAYCLEKMKLVTGEYKTVDADAIIDFFDKLQKDSSASTIHIILDNARAQKNKALKAYLENSRIKLHYLPPYSPNLNPIERIWKMLKEKTVYNRYHSSSLEFFAVVRDFFTEKIPKMLDELKSRVNDNFQMIELNPVNLVHN